MIKYLGNFEDLETIEAPLWHHKRGLSQTATGYGRKLATVYKVRHNGQWYRIYCHCFSNSGSLYIISKGERLYIN
jgi:hypothetical protein